MPQETHLLVEAYNKVIHNEAVHGYYDGPVVFAVHPDQNKYQTTKVLIRDAGLDDFEQSWLQEPEDVRAYFNHQSPTFNKAKEEGEPGGYPPETETMTYQQYVDLVRQFAHSQQPPHLA